MTTSHPFDEIAAGDDAAEDEFPSPSIKRAIQGLLLAAGAPLGWFAIRWSTGHALGSELSRFPIFYAYLSFATALVFTGFGYYLGWHEERLVEKNFMLHYRAVTDRLTGLRNSEYFWKRLEEAVARAKRDDTRLSLLMVDLDEFKQINDQFGHRVGDAVLKKAGELIDDNVRRADTAARVGGEEFAISCPETGIEEAREIAERLRARFAATEFASDDGLEFGATLSVGLACQQGGEANEEELYRAADEALYQAKKAGRNRVRVAGALSMVVEESGAIRRPS